MHKLSLIFFVQIIISLNCMAQGGFTPYTPGEQAASRRSAVRVFLNKFSIGLSAGYGQTFYKHAITNYSLGRQEPFVFVTPLPQGSGHYYTNWLNNPAISNEKITSPSSVSDTGTVIYKGNSAGIPLMLTLHYNLFMFRIGGGISGEYHYLPTLEPNKYFNELGTYTPDKKSTIFFRYFGMLGIKVFEYWGYSYTLDVQAGKVGMGKAFNKSLIDKGLYFNLGASVEKELSEYFRLTLRFSHDIKKYNISLPESNLAINHKQPAYYVQAGISLNFPEIRRCPIKNCEVKMKHIHAGHEFRGQPIYKKQNPKIGELEKEPFRIKLKKSRIEKKKEKK